MKKRLLMVVLLTVGVFQAAFAQTTISGKVSSAEDNQPVPGASVIVEGTMIGTITNVDGTYSIPNVPENAKNIVFSCIGFATKIAPKAATLNVVLDVDAEFLDEVVVTAMGISKEKKAIGYAMQDVKSDALVQAASTSLSSALEGKVAGLEVTSSSGMPGASAKITIRGSRSFDGDNTPLYVVDGMPIASTSDIDTGNSVTGSDYASRSLDIDPNDIESVNVLKGQAASALYGMRASNGVIIITTKKGSSIAKGKAQVTFTTNFTCDQVSTLPEIQTKYAQGSGGVYKPTASTSWGPLISELPNDPTYGGNTDNAYTQMYGKHEGMYYVPQRAKAGLDPWATPQAYNNAKAFFKTGLTWSNNVSVAQNNGGNSFMVSLGNTTNNGIVPNTGLNRYNARLAADANLSAHFKVGFSGNFVASNLSKSTSANNGIVATLYGCPPSYDNAGIPYYAENDPYTQVCYRSTSGFDNAYWGCENNKFTEKSQRFFGNIYAQYLTDFGSAGRHNLNVKYQLGEDAYSTDYSDVWGYGHSNGKGEISEYGYQINETNSLLTANYDWKISDDWNFQAMLGNELVYKNSKFIYAYGANYLFPGWNHMDNTTVQASSESTIARYTVGNFYNLSASYKNMLFLNTTGRMDMVSSMPRGNRTFFYPSVSLGFIFTELEPLKNDVLTFGKLRGSYAEVGQAGVYYNSYYSIPTYGGGFSNGTPVMFPLGGVLSYTPSSTLYDPNLRPQNTKSYEIGLDLGFFDGRIQLNYTYSRQNVKDQIFAAPMASSTGFSSMVTNGGNMHTNSHEVTLNAIPVQTKNFTWDIGINFSKIDNYVDELAEGVSSIFLGGFTDPQVRAGIGDKYPVIYGTAYLRNEDGAVVVDENGYPMVGEDRVIGSVSPDFRMAFSTGFQIYKFKLNMMFDWKQGGQMYCGTKGVCDYYGTTLYSQQLRDSEYFMFDQCPSVKITGYDANNNPIYAENDIKIPGSKASDYLSYLNDISEASVFDMSFLKLREISASYPVVDKKNFRLTLNVFARNLILWTSQKGFDPESSQGNNNMQGGFERFSLPGCSSFGAGLTFKF